MKSIITFLAAALVSLNLSFAIAQESAPPQDPLVQTWPMVCTANPSFYRVLMASGFVPFMAGFVGDDVYMEVLYNDRNADYIILLRSNGGRYNCVLLEGRGSAIIGEFA